MISNSHDLLLHHHLPSLCSEPKIQGAELFWLWTYSELKTQTEEAIKAVSKGKMIDNEMV